MSFSAALAIVAALLAAAPATAMPQPADVIWADLCDAAHPGRRVPLPLRRDRDVPPGACHAACAVMPDRRARR
jgi:hypothetical protein